MIVVCLGKKMVQKKEKLFCSFWWYIYCFWGEKEYFLNRVGQVCFLKKLCYNNFKILFVIFWDVLVLKILGFFLG